jgi:hypothetical protein
LISWISKVGCIPKKIDATELISSYIDKYKKNKRIIQLQVQFSISLGPSTFKNILKLPNPKMMFKVDEAKEFMKNRNGGKDLLPQYLEDSVTMPKDLSIIWVIQLRKKIRKWCGF